MGGATSYIPPKCCAIPCHLSCHPSVHVGGFSPQYGIFLTSGEHRKCSNYAESSIYAASRDSAFFGSIPVCSILKSLILSASLVFVSSFVSSIFHDRSEVVYHCVLILFGSRLNYILIDLFHDTTSFFPSTKF